MKQMLFRMLGWGAIATSSALFGCGNLIKSVEQDLQNELMQRLEIQGAQEKQGEPPAAHKDDKSYPTADSVQAPKELRRGQQFELRVPTQVAPANIHRVVFFVRGSGSFLEIKPDVQVAPDGGYYARVLGTLQATAADKRDTNNTDSSGLGGQAFDVDIAFAREDGKIGNYVHYGLQVSTKSVVECPAAASCEARTCGRDPLCGTSCGECRDGSACTYGGTCQALPAVGCLSRGCKTGETCNAATGDCIAPVAAGCITDGCATGETCNAETQKCDPLPQTTCVNTGCPKSEICDTVTGNCMTKQPENCLVAGCDKGSECNPATLACEVQTCPTKACEKGFSCNQRTGLCEELTNCLTDGCGKGEVCDTSSLTCVKQTCLNTACDKGLVCNRGTGKCQDSCSVTGCSSGTYCQDSGICVEGCTPATGSGNNLIADSCETGTSCNVQSGACLPNCLQLGCSEGHSCNPMTGVCDATSCTALGCPQGRQCNQTSGMCEPAPCGPLSASSCGSALTCALSNGAFVCQERQASGTNLAACASDLQCAPGLGCLSASVLTQCTSSAKCCAAYCDTAVANSCGSGSTCHPYDSWLGYGYCSTAPVAVTCKALGSRSECHSGENCAWTSSANDFLCTAVSAANTQGQVCSGATTCGLGQACVGSSSYAGCTGAECCAHLCNPDAANPGCPQGTTCQAPGDWSATKPGIGSCLPPAATTCNPVTRAECGTTEGCYWHPTEAKFTCGTPSSVKMAGAICTGPTDCGRGLICLNEVCSTPCSVTAPACGVNLSCTSQPQFSPAATYGVCNMAL